MVFHTLHIMYHFSFSWRLFLYPFLLKKNQFTCDVSGAVFFDFSLFGTCWAGGNCTYVFPQIRDVSCYYYFRCFSVPFFPPLLWDSNDTDVRYLVNCLTGPWGSDFSFLPPVSFLPFLLSDPWMYISWLMPRVPAVKPSFDYITVLPCAAAF